MKVKNIRGAFVVTPKTLTKAIYDETQTLELNSEFAQSKIIFGGGTVPTKEEVLNMTEASIRTDRGIDILAETPTFVVSTSYNVSSNKRIIRKKNIDALDIPYLQDGTITWAAIIISDGTADFVIVTPSIGQWGSTTDPIKVDNKTGLKDGYNIFKNLNIVLNNKRGV